jgi:hypothetical protein
MQNLIFKKRNLVAIEINFKHYKGANKKLKP